MNFNIKANLLGGQFSISHQLNNPDFNEALIATELMRNLKEHELYGRVALKGYDSSIDANLLSIPVEASGCEADWIHGFTGIIITVSLPDEYVSDDFGENMDMNKRLRFYNCFLENFMDHMIACGMTPFFQYDILDAVMAKRYTAHTTIMIPTLDSTDGAFFGIGRFSALEGTVTSAPRFDPFRGYEKTDTILKIPDGFHLERITLHPYTTDKDENEDWHVLVPNKTKPESN